MNDLANTHKTSMPTLANTEITVIKGVGHRMAETLLKLGIASVQDLLFHLPHRYLDRTRITPIAHLQMNANVVIQGRVTSNQVAFGKRRSLVVNVDDGSGSVRLRFYHFNAAQKNRLSAGAEVRCYGEVRVGASGLEFYHPEYDIIESGKIMAVAETLTPVYSLTEGISQSRLRSLIELGLECLKDQTPVELLPAKVNEHFGVQSLADALRFLHTPPPDVNVEVLLEGSHPYQQRLAFEELLAHYLVRQEARAIAQAENAPQIHQTSEKTQQLLDGLPFNLTSAQLT